MRIEVTSGVVIRDPLGRVLFERGETCSKWRLPAGSMKPGETVEQSMKRVVSEEIGLAMTDYELYSIFSGQQVQSTSRKGKEAIFVLFIFNARVNLEGRMLADGATLSCNNHPDAPLPFMFRDLDEVELHEVSHEHKALVEELKNSSNGLLRA